MRGLRMSATALIVSCSASLRVATPANADDRIRWIDVFFGSSLNGPIERAAAKLREKRCDAIVANDVSQRGVGFGSDDNEVTLLFADGGRHAIARAAKRAIADRLWGLLAARLPAREAADA